MAERPDNPPASQHSRRAIRSAATVGIFLAVAVVSGFVDLWSKEAVFDRLLSRPSVRRDIEQKLDFIETDDTAAKQSGELTRRLLRNLEISRRLCPGIRLTLSTNPGIVFGFDMIPSFVVNIITAGMIIGVIALFACSPAGDFWLHTALALILGGAIGNLYDRLFSSVSLPGAGLAPIAGHVRDFIDCRELGYMYIFNLADVWLVVGAAMILLQWLRGALKKEKEKQPASRG